ncbi:MAG: HlyD family efflux transporter periplasmic adaptor subunit [Spirulina sp. DLM2.Bin59]|nr:MAG: HlyD family efflux transporter periplasmic adaptor subunit [Spirulina sp. DLM2.Bin59]
MTQVAQRHYRTGITWLIGSGIVILSGVGAAFAFWLRPSSEAVTVKLVEVERGDVVKTIQAGGQVKLGNQQILTAPTTANNTAIIDRIEVNINSPIAADQVLIRLRNPDGLAQIEAQRLRVDQERLDFASKQRSVQAQELALEKARRHQRNLTTTAQDVDNARIALLNAQADLENQRQELPDLEEKVRTTAALVEQGYLAADELRQAEQGLRRGRSDLASRQRTVAQAQSALAHAEGQRQQILADGRDEVTSQALALATSRQGVTTSLQTLQAAEVNLQRHLESFANSSLIRATTAGRVLAIHVKEGDVVQQGKELVTIGDPRREEVEIQLTTLDAPLVKPFQKATVEAIGIVAGEFPARVEEVDRVAIASSGSGGFGGGNDPGRVNTVIVLDRPSGTLVPGSQVSVTIEVESRRNVVQVPSFLVQGEGEATFVWMINALGEAEERPVTLGVQGDNTTEILTGLEPGEKIVQPPGDTGITAGMVLEESKE